MPDQIPAEGTADRVHGIADPAGLTADHVSEPLVVTRSEERLAVGARRVERARVHVRRRVVTERLTVEVDVRREELVVEETPVPRDLHGVGPGASGTLSPSPYRSEPLVVVLREEVPDVRVQVRPYEQVRIDVVEVTGSQQVAEELRKEVIEVEGALPADAGPGLPGR